MSIVFSTLKTSLYDWAVANVPAGMPVVYYFPNAPRPTVDYVTLLISSVSQIGWDYQPRPTNNPGDIEGIGDREFTLQVQAYGGDPLTVLENLRTSLQKPTVLDTLRADGIVFVNWFTINDITDLVDSRFEQRATLDLLFRVSQQYLDSVGTIGTRRNNGIDTKR
jgi:uncharacterized RDD family membrane protein YckC